VLRVNTPEHPTKCHFLGPPLFLRNRLSFHDAGSEANTGLNQLRVGVLEVGSGEAIPDWYRRPVLYVPRLIAKARGMGTLSKSEESSEQGRPIKDGPEAYRTQATLVPPVFIHNVLAGWGSCAQCFCNSARRHA
jgi:hypothetical protein